MFLNNYTSQKNSIAIEEPSSFYNQTSSTTWNMKSPSDDDDTEFNLDDDFSDIDLTPSFDEFDTDFDEYDDYISEDDEF